MLPQQERSGGLTLSTLMLQGGAEAFYFTTSLNWCQVGGGGRPPPSGYRWHQRMLKWIVSYSLLLGFIQSHCWVGREVPLSTCPCWHQGWESGMLTGSNSHHLVQSSWCQLRLHIQLHTGSCWHWACVCVCAWWSIVVANSASNSFVRSLCCWLVEVARLALGCWMWKISSSFSLAINPAGILESVLPLPLCLARKISFLLLCFINTFLAGELEPPLCGGEKIS